MSAIAQLEARPHTATVRVLLIALSVLFAALATYMHPLISVFAFTLLAWRLWAAQRGAGMPPRWAKSLLALAGFGLVLATYRTVNGAEAGGALLMIMIALKLTEVRKLRDAVFVIVLAYFLVFAGFLYNQEIPFVAAMLAAGWALTGALLAVTRNDVQASFFSALKNSGRYLAQALPFAVIIFVLFPRIPGPLWGTPLTNQASATSGLDDTMTPGDISNLVMSNEIAFRVRFRGPPPPPSERYWRGPTLNFFNGQTWIHGITSPADSSQIVTRGEPLRYTVMLEPHRFNWLYALTVPTQYPDKTLLTRDYMLAARRPVMQRMSYDVESHLDHVLSTELSGLEQHWATMLPDRYNPRARELALAWRAEGADDGEIVQRALAMFRQQPFRYTLRPPRLGLHSVDDFLFETQAGFCEHYASAFTFLMRVAGVPSRVVTGYLGGEMNPYSEYMEVRQSDAHAWSEVWLEGLGWTRVDPTAAVAPERVERGLSEALAGEDLPWHLSRSASNLLVQLEMGWGAVNAAYYEFFLGFNPETQKRFLDWLGLENANWRKMVATMAMLLAAGALLLWMALLWSHRTPPLDTALRLYQRLQQRLARRLGAPRPHEGPRDFLKRVRRQAPELEDAVRDFIEQYVRMRYSATPAGRHGLRRLRASLKRVQA